VGWAIEEVGLDSQQEQEYLSSPQRPERPWGPITILFKRYQRLFFEGRSGDGGSSGCVKDILQVPLFLVARPI